MSCTVEILSLGNELLNGMVVNTNAHWLAKKITNLGGDVKRITVLSDDVKTIASEILEAINRKPDCIITTGGLGPTHDDLTLEGIAIALKLKLSINEEAEEFVRKQYAKHTNVPFSEVILRPTQKKMATLPEGFKPINNPVGTAPGVIGKKDDTVLVSLPGVPNEMKSIFNKTVSSLISSSTEKRYYNEMNLKIKGIIESELAPLIEKVHKLYPQIYVKSRPFKGGPTSIINIHLSTTSNTNSEGLTWLKNSITYIKQLLKKINSVVIDEISQNSDFSSSNEDSI